MANQIGGMKLHVFPLISITFWGIVTAIVGSESSCNPQLQMLYAAENRALQKFAYVTKTVRSRVICGRECSMDENCKSFNFDERVKLCELNNASGDSHSKYFIETQGSVYFDAYEDTPLFSLPGSSLPNTSLINSYRSCKMLLDTANHRSSGVYTIYPYGFTDGLQVYCDMETDGGGWIVFQRRLDGSEDFYINWGPYRSGFGDLSGEFWLGNDNLVTLTSDDSHGTWELRIDMDGWDGDTAWAKYTDFKISQNLYTLNFGQYDDSSTAGDSLPQWAQPFSARNRDNDGAGGSCADEHPGAWWYTYCGYSNLNGVYGSAINWYSWKPILGSVKTCSMKMRETEM